MKRQVRSLLFLVLLLGAVVPGKAGPGAGSGSVTADNSRLASNASDVNYIYTEALHLGPSANWQINGTIYFFGKSIRIAPGATLSGSGKIVLMNPTDNPYWEEMTAGSTIIDGNDGNFIDLNLELRNPSGAILSNIADIGYNADGSTNSLKIGKDLLLTGTGAHITLSPTVTSDLVFDNDATISGYGADNMIITGNTTSHVVKQNFTGAFTFPVGISAGDYTPARLNNTIANTLHVSVLDYANSASTEAGTDGIQRTWNIYADNASANTQVSLQHNVTTEQSGFNTTNNFVTRYGAGSTNSTGNAGTSSTPWQRNTALPAVKTPATAAYATNPSGMTGFSINTLTYTSFATVFSAAESYFSKASSSSPLGFATPATSPIATGHNPTLPGTSTGSVDLTASAGTYLPNASVSVTYTKPDGSTGTYFGSTDGTGKIVISNLPAGTYSNFVVTVDGGTPSSPGGSATLVDPPYGPVAAGHNPTAPGTSTGSIDLTSSTGSYPPNTAVVVTFTKPDGTTGTYSGSTDGTGKIIVSNLPAGTYTNIVVAINGGSPSPSGGPATLVDPPYAPVAEGHNPTSAGTSTGSVDLSASTGTYPANTPVVVTYTKPDGSTGTYSGNTNGSGAINIPNLPAGSYTNFVVTLNGGTPSAQGGTATLVDPPYAPVPVGHNPTIAGTSTGSIDLTASTGTYPVNTAVVVAYILPDGSAATYTGSTDGTGKISIPNLPAGTYSGFVVAINGGAQSPAGTPVTLTDPTPLPDLRPSITYTGSTNFVNPSSKTVTIRISNINLNTTTAGSVKFRIFRPTASTGLTLTLNATPEWDVTTSALYYELTLKTGLNITSTATTGFKAVTAVLARNGGNQGTVTLSTIITAGGGETNTANNSTSVTFTNVNL